MRIRSLDPLDAQEMGNVQSLLRETLVHEPYAGRVAAEKLFGQNPGSGEGICLGATKEGGELMGLVAAAGRFIKLLLVAERHRRKGIGKALLSEACTALGTESVRVGDHPGNYLTPGMDPRYVEGRAFLEAMGFRLVGDHHSLSVELEQNRKTTRVYAHRLESKAEGYRFRRAVAADKGALGQFVGFHFGEAWAHEAAASLEVGGIHIAEASEGGMVAFSCHDGNNRGLGWMGPLGTHPDHRSKGLGTCLLVHGLADLAERGLLKTTIAWVNEETDIFGRTVGAVFERTHVVYERGGRGDGGGSGARDQSKETPLVRT